MPKPSPGRIAEPLRVAEDLIHATDASRDVSETAGNLT